MSQFSFKLPDLGEGIVESEVTEWHINIGDIVEQDQHIADVQTDKATVEVTAPVGGTVVRLGCDAGQSLAVGSELILFATDDSSTPQDPIHDNKNAVKSEPSHVIISSQQPDSNDKTILTSPSVRLKAREQNINLHDVEGSGPHGRITHVDLNNFSASHSVKIPDKQPLNSDRVNSSTKDSADTTDIGVSKHYELKGIRRVIAKKLQQASQTIPHFSYIEEIDVTALEAIRQQLNNDRQNHLSKLTLLPFLIKAMVKVLPQFPLCNAHLKNEVQLTEFNAIHLGIATMTDHGLLVPVIRHCESLSLWQYAEQIQRLAKAARDNSISPATLRGSTITLSSLGALGGIASTPIINAPETCIIAINKIQQRPVVIDQYNDLTIEIRQMMNISASFDHRVVDGYDGARLIQAIKQLLESPEQLVD